MAHYKRRRPKNRRAGCLMCRPWKANGVATSNREGERYSDHRRRRIAELAIAER